MAVDMFLTIKGADGETQDEKKKSEKAMDILAWSWGMSQSGTTHMGSGSGAGKVNVQDISLTKYVDLASPKLMQACAIGKHYKEALLTVRKAGGEQSPYVNITMTDVIITSMSTGGSGGEDRLTENVSLNFGKVKFEYVQQKEDGSDGAKPFLEYDIAANKDSSG